MAENDLFPMTVQGAEEQHKQIRKQYDWWITWSEPDFINVSEMTNAEAD